MRMHEDQIDIGTDQVAALLHDQLPALSEQVVTR